MVLFPYKFQHEFVLYIYYHRMTPMVPNRSVPVDNNHPVIDLLILYLMGKMVLYYRQLQLYL